MRRFAVIAFALLCLSARLLDDTTPDYFRTTSTPTPGAPFSISVWFNSDDGTINQIIVAIADSADSDHFWRIVALGTAGDNQIAWRVRGGPMPAQEASTSPAGYTVGTWHHACAVEASATDRRILLDGGNKGTNTTSRTPSGANRVAVGFRASGVADPFSGKIGQVCLYNIALSDAECATLAAGFSCLSVRRDRLSFFAPLNGGQSPEAEIMGNRNLTITGAPTKVDDPPIPHAIIAP